eukprot:6466487-Amphidinium_carterae.1
MSLCRARREVERAQHGGPGLKDAALTASKANMAFSVQYHTVPGQSIHMVGSSDAVVGLEGESEQVVLLVHLQHRTALFGNIRLEAGMLQRAFRWLGLRM